VSVPPLESPGESAYKFATLGLVPAIIPNCVSIQLEAEPFTLIPSSLVLAWNATT
jgi:hypothetical protein